MHLGYSVEGTSELPVQEDGCVVRSQGCAHHHAQHHVQQQQPAGPAEQRQQRLYVHARPPQGHTSPRSDGVPSGIRSQQPKLVRCMQSHWSPFFSSGHLDLPAVPSSTCLSTPKQMSCIQACMSSLSKIRRCEICVSIRHLTFTKRPQHRMLVLPPESHCIHGHWSLPFKNQIEQPAQACFVHLE